MGEQFTKKENLVLYKDENRVQIQLNWNKKYQERSNI